MRLIGIVIGSAAGVLGGVVAVVAGLAACGIAGGAAAGGGTGGKGAEAAVDPGGGGHQPAIGTDRGRQAGVGKVSIAQAKQLIREHGQGGISLASRLLRASKTHGSGAFHQHSTAHAPRTTHGART